MELVKLTKYCEDMGFNRRKVDAEIKRMGIVKHRLGDKPASPIAITARAAEIITRALSLPDELKPKLLKAQYIRDAPNRKWGVCRIEGREGIRPVLIPHRYRGKMGKKAFNVERIEDKDGVTYRHEWYGRVDAARKRDADAAIC